MSKNRLVWIVPGLLAGVMALGSRTVPVSADPGDVGAGIFARPLDEGTGHVHWRGIVDDSAIVYIHRGTVRTVTTSGRRTRDVSTFEFGRLPARMPEFVELTDVDGRGEVSVIQQPSFENDHTAAVRIYDPQPGSSMYSFTLQWTPLGQ
ncbi:MAG: hypothetical protein ACLQVD_06655 [Capsulimonadaceae bacterium]